MRLSGKTALVTAAAAGIGRATALAFAREGAGVIATDVDREGLSTLGQMNPAIRTEAMDVTDKAAIERAHQRTPRIDVLMYCAGFVHTGTILECSEDEWAKSVDVNMTGLVRVVQRWLPGMIAQGHGSIIAVASVISSLHTAPLRSAYAATKGGVIGLTKSIAMDFGSKGIRCNAICPGAMDSPSFAQRLRARGDEASAREAIAALVPAGRVGRLEEAAALAVYLASDESAYTTGGVHIIDGGWKL